MLFADFFGQAPASKKERAQSMLSQASLMINGPSRPLTTIILAHGAAASTFVTGWPMP